MPSRNIKTAKEILTSHDFLVQRQQSQRFVHHEFQDYAYRLAAELGDLAHKQIYMRLAKTTPRHLLEKALAFTGDYKHTSRGKLFMWKLKQLRLEAKLVQDNNNFDAEFIYTRSAENQEQLASILLKKLMKQNDIADTAAEIISEYVGIKRVKALVAGQNIIVAPLLKASGIAYEGWELPRALVRLLKARSLKAKKVLPDLSKLSKQYDLIWYSDYWKLVPLETEDLWLNQLLNALKDKGKLVIATNADSRIAQQWELFMHKDQPYYYFAKSEDYNRITTLLAGKANTKKLAGGLIVIQK